jgi:hypothetical protein
VGGTESTTGALRRRRDAGSTGCANAPRHWPLHPLQHDVAQTSSLPYRGLPIRWRWKDASAARPVGRPCRLEIGETADWKSALQLNNALVRIARGSLSRPPGEQRDNSKLSATATMFAPAEGDALMGVIWGRPPARRRSVLHLILLAAAPWIGFLILAGCSVAR